MAEKKPFKIGEQVVSPMHGVGIIKGYTKQNFAGVELELVIVAFEKDRLTLRIPMDKIEISGLRALASPEVMKEALKTLKGRAHVKRTMWSKRAQEYEAKINSGNPVFIAEVLRDLHRRASKPEQSFSERQIYENALERLASEFAAIESVDTEKAIGKLEKLMTP